MRERNDWIIGSLAAPDAYRGDYPWLAQDAGIDDIGRRRYGSPGDVWTDQPEVAETGAAIRGVTGMINPERFSDAVSRMPSSQNVERGPPAKLNDDRVKAMFGMPQSFAAPMAALADQSKYAPADAVLPPPRNSARDIPEIFLPNLSRPETYGPQAPPSLQATPEGKVPTGDPRMMGALADIGSAAYNAIPFGGPIAGGAKLAAPLLVAGFRRGILTGAKDVAEAVPRLEPIAQRTDLPTRAYHGTHAVFPEFKYEAELGQVDPNLRGRVNTALGPHAAKDPAIASYFATRGFLLDKQPHVIPLRIPAEEKFLQVEQPVLKAGKAPLWQRVADDEASIDRMAARESYARDPDLLARYVQNRTGVTLADARSRATALLEGERVKVGQKKRTLDEVIDQYGGSPYSRNDRLTMADIARKAWQDQGYEGLRYINTYEGGAPGVKDPTATSYIIFDPRKMRSEFAKFDPEMAWSRNLMTGVAGAGAVPPAMGALARQDQYQQ